MPQSNVIFGFLLAAWLVFIIQRGELGIYWGLLAKAPQAPSAGPSATAAGVVSTAAGVVSTAAEVVSVAG